MLHEADNDDILLGTMLYFCTAAGSQNIGCEIQAPSASVAEMVITLIIGPKTWATEGDANIGIKNEGAQPHERPV